MKEKTDGKTQKNKPRVVTKDNNKSGRPKGEKAARCFGCGSNEHLARNCTKKDNGPKCFKCNKFGHIAAKCDEREKTTDGNVKSVNVVTRSSTDDEITVELNNVKIQAMIDTGTDYTLLRRSEYRKIGSPPLRETLNTFEGFGSARVKSDGAFRATVTIQGEDYDGNIFVIPDYAMSHLMLVGKKITRQMEVVIRGGLITITKLHTNKSRDDGLERKEVEAEETDDVFCELRLVNLIETRSVDVDDRYRKEIEEIIEGHVPKRGRDGRRDKDRAPG